MERTIGAIATAHGDGAVAIIRISGPESLSYLKEITRRTQFQNRKVTLVDVKEPTTGEVLDRGMVCLMLGPNSYTGEDVVEFYLHGGAFQVQRIFDVLLSMGVMAAEPGEFTKRAFLRGKLDLTQAEAVAEMIAAKSERALKNSLALLRGELGSLVKQVREGLVDWAADLEACIDFADELERPVPIKVLEERGVVASRELEKLIGSYRRGKRLNGFSVGLFGAVNAGKSSLINRWVGEKRVLVSDQAGTTRDFVEVETELDGFRVVLVDTAGQREISEMSSLEREGYEMGQARLARCDLWLWLIDGTAADVRPLAEAKGHDVLVAINKCDLLDAAGRLKLVEQVKEITGQVPIVISVENGEGVEKLTASVIQMMLCDNATELQLAKDERVVITQERHWQLMSQARSAVDKALAALRGGVAAELVVEDVRVALIKLGEVTGETFTEDVLGSIFRRFCIGK